MYIIFLDYSSFVVQMCYKYMHVSLSIHHVLYASGKLLTHMHVYYSVDYTHTLLWKIDVLMLLVNKQEPKVELSNNLIF